MGILLAGGTAWKLFLVQSPLAQGGLLGHEAPVLRLLAAHRICFRTLLSIWASLKKQHPSLSPRNWVRTLISSTPPKSNEAYEVLCTSFKV